MNDEPLEPMSVRVTFTITLDDIVDTSRNVSRDAMASVRVVSGALVLIGLAVWFVAGQTLGLVMGALGLLAFLSDRVRWFDRMSATRSGSEIIGQVCEFSFDASGIHSQRDGVSGSFEWRVISEVRIDTRAMAFYKDKRVVSGLPLRAFDATTLREFKEVVRRYAPQARLSET